MSFLPLTLELFVQTNCRMAFGTHKKTTFRQIQSNRCLGFILAQNRFFRTKEVLTVERKANEHRKEYCPLCCIYKKKFLVSLCFGSLFELNESRIHSFHKRKWKFWISPQIYSQSLLNIYNIWNFQNNGKLFLQCKWQKRSIRSDYTTTYMSFIINSGGNLEITSVEHQANIRIFQFFESVLVADIIYKIWMRDFRMFLRTSF